MCSLMTTTGHHPGWRHALATLVLWVLSASTASASVPAVFTAAGKSLVLCTPEWTLLIPLPDTKATGTGIFIHGTNIYAFPAPKNKV
jgi:hypothetical protein